MEGKFVFWCVRCLSWLAYFQNPNEPTIYNHSAEYPPRKNCEAVKGLVTKFIIHDPHAHQNLERELSVQTVCCTIKTTDSVSKEKSNYWPGGWLAHMIEPQGSWDVIAVTSRCNRAHCRHNNHCTGCSILCTQGHSSWSTYEPPAQLSGVPESPEEQDFIDGNSQSYLTLSILAISK